MVVYKNLPFAQASKSEKLRISASICCAMNPALGVMLVHDGSLLDDDGLKFLADMAEENGMQVWVERVGEGEECSVIIEDGHVKGVEPVEEEPDPEDPAEPEDDEPEAPAEPDDGGLFAEDD